MKPILTTLLLFAFNICIAQTWQYVGSNGFSGEAELFSGQQSNQSLKISPSGVPYVAFSDGGNGSKTSVLTFNGTNWGRVGTTLGISAGKSFYQCLAISAGGVPYVSYQDSTLGYKFAVMRFNGNSWNFLGTIPGIGNVSYSTPSLAVSPSGVPFIAYHLDQYPYSAIVLSFNGSNWGTVGSSQGISSGISAYESLAFSPSGIPYLAYSDFDKSQKVNVLSFDGQNWGLVGSVSGISAGQAFHVSLAVSSAGVPYVAYSDYVSNSKTTVLSFNGGKWLPVGGSGGISLGFAENQSLAISPSGVPYVAFRQYDEDFGTTVMRFNGIKWVEVGKSHTGDAGNQSLAIDPISEVTYVAYRDQDNGGKTTIIKVSSGWESVGNSIYDISPDPASGQRMVLNPSGIPFVSHRNDNTNQIEVLSFDGVYWNMVGSALDVNSGPADHSLAFDPIGVPYLACVSYDNPDANYYELRILRYNSSSWSNVGTVSGLNPQGAYRPSLAFSPTGVPYVAFGNFANNDQISVISFDGTNWGLIGKDGINNFLGNVQYINLQFSPSGVPYVAFKDYSVGGKACVLSFNGSNWGNVGNSYTISQSVQIAYLDFAFSPSGVPYVAYRDGYATGLKTTVLSFNGSNWGYVGSVDFTPGATSYQSLAFSPSGTPYLAYTDDSTTGKTIVLRFDGNKWLPAIDSGIATKGLSQYNSLEFSASGELYLAYKDSWYLPGNKTKVITLTNEHWSKLGTAQFGITGGADQQNLAFSPTGVPYIAFSDNEDEHKVNVIRFDGSDWSKLSNIGLDGSQYAYFNMAISPAGIPHVAYTDLYEQLIVVSFNGKNWGAVGSVAGTGFSSRDYVNIAFSPSGVPHVIYNDYFATSKVTVISFNGTNWGIVGGVGVGYTGGVNFPSIAFNPSGVLYATYGDPYLSSGKAHTVSFNGSNWGDVGNVNYIGGAANFLNLAVSPSGVPHIAFVDMSTNKNTVLSFSGSNWEPMGVITVTGGFYLSLDFGASGTPYLALSDRSKRQKTTVLSFNGSNWGPVSVAGISKGSAYYQSLKVHPQLGEPWVAYRSDIGGATLVQRYGKTLLTVAANDAAKEGPSNPIFTSTVKGLLHGDAISINYIIDEKRIVPSVTGAALANYSVVIISGILTIYGTDQTIFINAIPDITLTGTSQIITITGSASSGLPLTYDISTNPPSIAYLNGNIITVVDVGTIKVTAVQAGSDYVNSASKQVQFGVVGQSVVRIDQTISITGIANITLTGVSQILTIQGVSSSGLPLLYAILDTGKEPIALNNGNGNIITVTGPGTVYAMAYQPGSERYYSAVFTFKFDVFANANSTSVEEELNQAGWIVYPNPTQGLFFIESKTVEQYTISTIEGKLLQSDKLLVGTNQVIANLSKGMYLIRVGNSSRKLLID